jgi:hypothetical protein
VFRHADTVVFLRLQGPGKVLGVHSHECLPECRVERTESRSR